MNEEFAPIKFATRSEACKTLDGLLEIMGRTYATVADLYGLCRVTRSFSDDQWGWYDLRRASVYRVKDGYELRLPTPVEINNSNERVVVTNPNAAVEILVQNLVYLQRRQNEAAEDEVQSLERAARAKASVEALEVEIDNVHKAIETLEGKTVVSSS